MSISYNTNIPLATDTISQSQGQLYTNFNSINSIWNVDHYNFSSTYAGKHSQITIPANGTLASMSGLQSGIVTAAGSADNTTSQLFFKNAQSTFPLSAIKVFGFAIYNGSSVDLKNSYNCSSVTYSSSTYTVNFSFSLPSAEYAVIVSPYKSTNTQSFYVNTESTSNFTIQLAGIPPTNSGFSFVVLQV